MLEVREKTRGQRPGDAYVRIVRPFEEEFEHGEKGQLIASERTIDTSSGFSRRYRSLRNFLFGRPISSEHEEHERLTKVKALAIFSSDNISSSAYGPEEIMRVLALAGLAVMSTWTLTLAVLIIVMLAIVTISYRQTIKAYPKGASSYIVAGDNLGDVAGILAASALLIGYVVTVAVSISAGVAAITSIVPELYEYRVPVGVVAVDYGARPTLTSDAVALCLASGNAVVLRGSRRARRTNRILAEVMTGALIEADAPPEAIALLGEDREELRELVGMQGLVDVVIPRGGEELRRFISEHARVPVIKHLAEELIAQVRGTNLKVAS